MCDAFSLGAAVGDIGAGIAGRIDARSRGDFQAAQLEAMGVLASAQASDEMTAIRADFSQQMSANIAAMAISGLDPASFDAVVAGNRADLADAEATIHKNARRKQSDLNRRASIAQMEGEIEGAVTMLNGFVRAGDTIYRAEDTYQNTHTGQTRGEALSASFGSSFFKKG